MAQVIAGSSGMGCIDVSPIQAMTLFRVAKLKGSRGLKDYLCHIEQAGVIEHLFFSTRKVLEVVAEVAGQPAGPGAAYGYAACSNRFTQESNAEGVGPEAESVRRVDWVYSIEHSSHCGDGRIWDDLPESGI